MYLAPEWYPAPENDPCQFDICPVVGAGSAGCVVASRLSETSTVSVLLLEAGPDDRKHARTSIPALADTLLHSELDWGYFTEPQQFAMSGFKENVSDKRIRSVEKSAIFFSCQISKHRTI